MIILKIIPLVTALIILVGCSFAPETSSQSIPEASADLSPSNLYGDAFMKLHNHEKEWLEDRGVDAATYATLLEFGFSNCDQLKQLTQSEWDYLFPLDTVHDRLRELWGNNALETTTFRELLSKTIHIQELETFYVNLKNERGIYPHEADMLQNMSIRPEELFTEPMDNLVRLLLLGTERELTESETLEKLGYSLKQSANISVMEKEYIFPITKLRDKLTSDGFDPETIYNLRLACPVPISYRQIIDLAISSNM